MTRIVRKMRQFASSVVDGFEDRTAEVKQKILSITKVLRRRTSETIKEVDKITCQIVEIAQGVCEQAKQVVQRLERHQVDVAKSSTRKLRRAADITAQLLEQARSVVEGNRILPARIVSVHDPDARPIKKGKLARPTKFGYKVRIDETESGFVTGYQAYIGNPSDESLLVPATEHHVKVFGTVPHAVATDRGFTSSANEMVLREMSVSHVSTPVRGKKSQRRTHHEQEPWFKDLQRFRAGGEAKISLLKRKYGLNRSLFRGIVGTEAWVGYGILAHNLQRMARIG